MGIFMKISWTKTVLRSAAPAYIYPYSLYFSVRVQWKYVQRIICDFRENQHREGRSDRVGVSEIVLKGVQWKCDSLGGKHALVKTVHCVTERRLESC